jgi:predicted DNA-binding antitoxin AbrB/MazE fold protein
MKEFNQQFSTIRLREEFEGQYDKVLFSTNDAQLDSLLNTRFYDQLENEGDYYSLDTDTFGKFEDLAFSMGFNMTDIVKKENVDEEGSVTSGGEAYLPGLDVPEKKYKAGYVDKVEEEKDVEPKLAAGKSKNIMKGWKDSPSIPNRPSKGGFIYKQLFEYLKENKEEFKKDDIVKYNSEDWKVIKVLRDGDMYKLEKDGIEANVSLDVLKRQQKENLKEGIKTEIAKRNKSQQFNEAAKLANKKLKEVNAILEYASKLKLELHETGNAPTNRLMEKIKSSVVEAYKKIKELSPATRNSAATAAIDKSYSSDSQLVKSKLASQYETFKELPKELHNKAEEIAKKISDSLRASDYKQTLKKVISSTNSEIAPYITYKINMVEHGNNRRLSTFAIHVEKDKFEESPNNPGLSRDLNSAVLVFIKKLQREL